jgi:hypothetical protein
MPLQDEEAPTEPRRYLSSNYKHVTPTEFNGFKGMQHRRCTLFIDTQIVNFLGSVGASCI